MENRMTEKNRYTLWEYPQMLQHFEYMAQNGWMLTECNEAQFEYEKSEPKTVHFAATFFPAYDFLDPNPPENLHRLWDFCAQNGWRHITDNASMQIFCNEEENPTPLHTDAVVQLENFHAVMNVEKLKEWRNNVLVNGIFFAALFAVYVLISTKTSIWQLFSAGSPVMLLMLARHFYILLTDGAKWLYYSLWHKKAVHTAEKDDIFTPPKHSVVLDNIDTSAMVAFLAAMLVFMYKSGEIGFTLFWVIVTVAFVGLYVFIAAKLKKEGVSAKENRQITTGIMIAAVVVFIILLPAILIILQDYGVLKDVITVTTTYPQ